MDLSHYLTSNNEAAKEKSSPDRIVRKNISKLSTQCNISFFLYGLLTNFEVKMAGCWPSSFLRVFGPRRSRGPETRKKRTRSISSHLDRLFGFWGNFSCGTPWVVPLYLARSGSQSQSAIWFIFPAYGASHIIRNVNVIEK